MKFAFLTTHPIQYQVPVFRHLAVERDLDFQVLFCTLPDARQQGAEFGVEFQWDIPLLEGYRHHVLDNVAKNPGLMHFAGCDTPGVADYLRDNEFDVVGINGWVVKSCLQTARACRRLGIPCIVRGEANNLRRRPWWKRAIHRKLMRLFSAYCPIGTASEAFYRELGIPPQRLFRSPYCIENERIAAASPRDAASRAAARNRFGIARDAVCFLFCGKLIDKKQPLGLLAAWERLAGQIDAADGPKPHLMFVGDGHLRRQCEHLADQSGLPVSFAGFLNQSEIGAAYSASDALVLPSDHGETWGLVVNEAFAAGLPALVSDQVGCHPDLVIENQTGWVHRFGDWDQLAEQMRAAISDPERLRSFGEIARKRIEDFSPRAAADGLIRAARSVTPIQGGHCVAKSK